MKPPATASNTRLNTMSIVENRYDFALLFDCQDGNPNGDRTPTTVRDSIRRPFKVSSPTSA